MNKVVLTTLTMSAVLILTGCSTSGSGHSARNGSGGYSSAASCPTCGPGSSAVQHGHNNRRASGGGGNGTSIAAVVGGVALLGLLVSAIDDDDDDDDGKR